MSDTFKRAEEDYLLNYQLSLDLNQPAQSREHYKAKAERAAAVLLELHDDE